MITLRDYLCEKYNFDEAALMLGSKKSYPKYNNILIMAGGSGSGKGFILNNVIAFQGKLFDVDDMKSKIIDLVKKYPDNKLNLDFKEKYGKSIADLNLKNPTDTSNLHMFLKEKGLDDKRKYNFFKNVKSDKNKPNVIFDITLKDTKALKEISEYADISGYDKENMHIVWVLDSIENAIKKNAERARSVSNDLLVSIHSAVSKTMKEIITNTNQYRKYADGDIWVVFNAKNIDVSVIFGKEYVDKQGKKIRPKYIKDYISLKIKDAGKPAKSLKELDAYLFDKLKSYVPDTDNWK